MSLILNSILRWQTNYYWAFCNHISQSQSQTFKVVCNRNERLWNKCKRICLSFSQASVTIKVKETWAIVQRNCEITRMVEWKNICKILWQANSRGIFKLFISMKCVFFLCIFIYMGFFIQKKHIWCQLSTILMKLGKILDYWFFLHSLSQIPIYTRGLRVYKLN